MSLFSKPSISVVVIMALVVMGSFACVELSVGFGVAICSELNDTKNGVVHVAALT